MQSKPSITRRAGSIIKMFNKVKKGFKKDSTAGEATEKSQVKRV